MQRIGTFIRYRLLRSKMFYITTFLLVLPWLIPVNRYQPAPDYKPFPDSHFMYVNGTRYHFRLNEPVGDNIKGNVIFIHGFAGNTFSWRNNTEILVSNGYRVLLVDLPAFGYSDKSQSADFSDVSRVKAIWKICDSISSNRWNIIGHSMGGVVAGAMAALHPERTQSVVFTDGVYITPKAKPGIGSSISGAVITSSYVQRWVEVLAKYGFINETSFKKLLSDAYACEADSEAVRGYLEPFRIRRSASAIFDMSAFTDWPPISDHTLNMPMLIVWGSKDTWVPVASGKSFAQLHRVSDFIIIEGAGHCPMETHADQYNTAVLQFLQSNN